MLTLSSSHCETQISNEDGKPTQILDYNAHKSGVDVMDGGIEEFTVRRKTARWPLLIAYNIIDVSWNNSFILMSKCGYENTRKNFLRKCNLT